jgi:hypothetical protein
MTIEIPVTYTDIQNAYARLTLTINQVFEAQKTMNNLENEKADIWAQLTSNPDFKPGNSNLQRDSKLRAASPLFMDKYEKQLARVDTLRQESDAAQRQINQYKDMLALGRILTAIKDE